MCNNTLKKKKITISEDHLLIYNIVDVCKQIIVDGDKDLQNFSKAFLQGYFFSIVVQFR